MEQTMEPVAQTTPAQSAVETPTPAGAPGSAPTPPKSKKKRKKTTRRIIALVLVIALGFGLYRHFGKKEGAGEQQVVKDTVMYGSITSTVEGSGMVKAKNSETITLATAGTVTDVFVTEGQQVMAGDPLFTYNSPAAEKEVRDAKADIEGYQKKLNAAYKDIAALTISDTSTVTVSATVDERNVSYLKVGMSVNLSQWNGQSFGTISSVSLSSSANNGVVTYPFTIEADNTEGTLQVNSYVDYNLTASQSDNCLVLPIQAVRTVGLEDGTSATVVYVQADSEPDNMVQIPYMDEEIPAGFYPVQVEIGIQDNYNVEIKSGVEEGTVVFTQIMSDNVWG